MRYMPTQEELIQKLYNEIQFFIQGASSTLAASQYLKQLGVMAAIRNELEDIPLYDIQIKMLLDKENILQCAYEHWQCLDSAECGFDKDIFADVTHDFLAKEDYEYRDKMLYEKVSIEFKDYLDELKQKSPLQIIEAAYQFIMMQDILMSIESHNLEQQQIDVLLTLEKPLKSIYDEWLRNDCSHMEMLSDTMEEFIDKQQHNLSSHNYDLDGQPPEHLKDYYEVYELDDEALDADEQSEDMEQ
jgi:hypothetical protein